MLFANHERRYITSYMEGEEIKNKPCESFWMYKDGGSTYIGHLEGSDDRLISADLRQKDRRYNPTETKVIWKI